MNRFDEFCTTIQDDAGAPRLSPLPASPATILAYMGFLAEEGKVKASSLSLTSLPSILLMLILASTNQRKATGLF